MKILRISAKQQIIAVAAGLGILMIVFIVVLVVPQILRLGTLGVEEQSALTDLNNAKATYSTLQDLRKGSRKTESDLLRVDRKAPQDAELPALLIQIEDISSKSGISLLSVKPSALVQETDYAQVPLEIQIDGYFFSLLDFIYRLEKLPRIINVQGIEIKEGKQLLPNIDVTIKAVTFVTTPGVKASTATTAPTTGSTGATGGTSSTPTTGGTSTGAAQ
jgi:type IV pilus assembly protein PilO